MHISVFEILNTILVSIIVSLKVQGVSLEPHYEVSSIIFSFFLFFFLIEDYGELR